MKNLCFILILVCTAGQSKAQQAKAYETLRYIAREKHLVFQLDYTDGYIGASTIRLKQTHQKTQVFTPEGATPDINGNFVLRAAADKGEIVLVNINEETVAPEIILGRYRVKGTLLNLIFNKPKKQLKKH